MAKALRKITTKSGQDVRKSTRCPESNKERLLRVAIDCFARKGYKGTSIRDLARQMGMSISNIYYYFGSKAGLLQAILEQSTMNLEDKLRVTDLDMEPLDRFRLILDTHISVYDAYYKEAKIFFLNEEDLNPTENELIRKLQREILNIYIRELGRLKEAGYIKKSKNLSILALNVLGVINWRFRWYRKEGSLSLEEIAEEMISFIMNGVLGQQGQKIQKGLLE